jgi:hypothetical protein
MSNIIIQQTIQILASMILGSDVFTRVLGVIQRWEEKQIAGLEKKAGVLAEFEIIGLKLTGWLANIAIELAVGYTKYGAKQGDKPDVKQTVINDLEKGVK